MSRSGRSPAPVAAAATQWRARAVAFAVPVLALALAAVGWSVVSDDNDRSTQPHTAAVAPSAPAAGEPVAELPAATAAAHVHGNGVPVSTDATPASLQGSDVDGGVGTTADGSLRIDLSLRRLFDWHRAAAGEHDEPTIRRAVAAALAARVAPLPAAEALTVYDRYVAYLQASAQLPFEPDPLAQFDALRALRIELLGPAVAEAFFAEEEWALEARLLRRRIADDRSSSEAERVARLAAFDASLPPSLRPSPELQQAADADALAAAYDAAGIDAQQRWVERAALFGDQAADRLALLDQARDGWQRRVDDYLAQQASLQRQATLDDAERRRRLQQWLQQHFDAAEQRRLAALIEAGVLRGPG